eukprot:TRINITY_DN2642_c0_g2_i1.p1 TRINITY_DN2642_c0_g2~~TRINITY_DN2642_c0_g2_i1.p1  ORF type:complete len:900 (-),score=76.19 TRINITY_DN2642_c0_g2_i1:308-3007(-)
MEYPALPLPANDYSQRLTASAPEQPSQLSPYGTSPENYNNTNISSSLFDPRNSVDELTPFELQQTQDHPSSHTSQQVMEQYRAQELTKSDQEYNTKQQQQQSISDYVRELVVGIINTIITLPSMLSFAIIIFQDPFYADQLPNLAKLVFFASGIIQLVFMFLSSMKFAVGQVQDIGLIFLSAMATSIAQQLWWNVPESQRTEQLAQKVMGTALITTALSTALVGLLIIVIGKLKLAQLVQFVPVPVVGGYLGYVGYFCVVAGVSLASGINFVGFQSWIGIFNLDNIVKLIPTIGSALLCFFVSRKIRSNIALPLLLILLPILFYLVVLIVPRLDLSIAEKNGWTPPPISSGNIIDIYKLYNLYPFSWDNIAWKTIFNQFIKFFGLFIVVSFGSCMDIAAVQQELPQELDYNKELITVGISNLVTGLLGAGFTGSYIFSQTIFTMRLGVKTFINAAVISLAEILLFLIPGSVVRYFPNFYLGALMVWFGVEISYDWLIISYKKCTKVEYMLLLSTFTLIMIFSQFFPVEGLEIGIFVGILLSALQFIFSYSSVQSSVIAVVSNHSTQVYTNRRRMVLELATTANLVALQLNGYIFFGNSVAIAQKIRQMSCFLQKSLKKDDVKKVSEKLEVSEELCCEAISSSPKYLIIDFSKVTGLDVTAARQFATLKSTIELMGIKLVISHTPNHRQNIQKLLRAYNVLSEQNKENRLYFESLEEALKHCKEELLEKSVQLGLCEEVPLKIELSDILYENYEQFQMNIPYDQTLVSQLEEYIPIKQYKKGDAIYSIGDQARAIYLIRSGKVKLYFKHSYGTNELIDSQWSGQMNFGVGSIIGGVGYILQKPRFSKAVCLTDVSVYCFSLNAMQQMVSGNPELLILVQSMLLRGISSVAANAIEASHVS